MPLPRLLRTAARKLMTLTTVMALAGPLVLGAAPAAAQARADDSIEITFWNTVKDSIDPRDLRDYLTKYPKGHFAGLAKRRIDRLEGRPAQPEPAEPETPARPEPAAEPAQDAETRTQPARPAEMRRLVRHYVEGEGYDTTSESSFEECSRRCLGDARCRMMEFYKPKRKCNLFDHRKAVKTADNDADVAIKSGAGAD